MICFTWAESLSDTTSLPSQDRSKVCVYWICYLFGSVNIFLHGQCIELKHRIIRLYCGPHTANGIIHLPWNWQVGHRTYNNLKTIRPNMPLLGQLFLNKTLTWPEFRESVVEGHQNRQGQIRLRKPKQSLYTYPAPDCMCQAWERGYIDLHYYLFGHQIIVYYASYNSSYK